MKEVITVAVLTSSDSGYAGLREDASGPRICELVTESGYQVVKTILLPDDKAQLIDAMKKICDNKEADLLLTTGGTGFSVRDCMPEATMEVVERLAPGIPEAMRYLSLQITKRAMLSRSVAGIRKETLIVNLPGSPKAVEECLSFILPELEHGIEILKGTAKECARIEEKQCD